MVTIYSTLIVINLLTLGLTIYTAYAWRRANNPTLHKAYVIQAIIWVVVTCVNALVLYLYLNN